MKNLVARDLADVVVDTDVIVVGTGVAGLAAALSLSPRRVTVITKTRLGAGGSSPWAQGGVAAAVAQGDSPAQHAADTLVAGAGLCDPRAVDVLTQEGPGRVRRLIAMGAQFDRGAHGELVLGREGAHGQRRILHAGGDQTGAEMVRALVAAVEQDPAIDVQEFTFAMDLVRRDERVTGVLCRRGGRRVLFRAGAVILATGGFGRLYAKTTNPVENTGDGLAMAARAGAQLADLEMVQFHPTALDVAATGGTLPLVTEALRGEGAWLVDESGRRFMPSIHAAAELAPRDIVARAIWRLQQEGRRVFLDARHSVGAAFPERFPTVFNHCARHGLDPRIERIPVTPAAHYAMAGVAADEHGRTSLDGLWVCGEVSSTGAHGANRLASNSLLEALVFGHRAALDVALGSRPPERCSDGERVRRETAAPREVDGELRNLMWNNVGLIRHASGLSQAIETLDGFAGEGRDPDELTNLWTVGRLVAAAALVREESRGSHHRTDFPESDPIWNRRLFWTYRDVGEGPLQKVAHAVGSAWIREIA